MQRYAQGRQCMHASSQQLVTLALLPAGTCSSAVLPLSELATVQSFSIELYTIAAAAAAATAAAAIVTLLLMLPLLLLLLLLLLHCRHCEHHSQQRPHSAAAERDPGHLLCRVHHAAGPSISSAVHCELSDS
eukprot:6759-Heterococcus_DN1.PRE.1